MYKVYVHIILKILYNSFHCFTFISLVFVISCHIFIKDYHSALLIFEGLST